MRRCRDCRHYVYQRPHSDDMGDWCGNRKSRAWYGYQRFGHEKACGKYERGEE